MVKGKAKIAVGVTVTNITGKVVFSRDLFDRLKDLLERISEDDEIVLSDTLELRRLARELVEEAIVA